MEKRDIRINYDLIEVILKGMKSYADGLKELRTATEKVNERISSGNDADSIERLEKKYKKVKKRLDNCYEEVNALYTLLRDYKEDMTGIIVPKRGMTRVGRNDIYWNLKAVNDTLHNIQYMKKDVQIYLEDEGGHIEEEKRVMRENYRKLEEKIWNQVLFKLKKEAENCKENLENYYKQKVVKYENKDDDYRWEAEKIRMKYASVWDHMKQAYVNHEQEKMQIAKGALRAVKDITDGLSAINEIVYYANSGEVAVIIKKLSNNPPEWAEKMLGESEEYFGQIAEIFMHPGDTAKKLVQEKSDTYEEEGLVCTGAYIITDVLIGKITVAGITKAAGKGGGTAKKIAGVVNEGEEITDAAKTAKKMEDAVDNLESFYDDVYDSYYGKQFDPLEEGAIPDSDEVVDIAKTASKSGTSTNKLFKNQSLLDEHYGKHGQEIADVLGDSNYSIDKYLDDANYIINNGTYTLELNGYVSFMSGKKYGFVGLDRTTGDITTFHIKNISELSKKAPSLGFER